MAPRGGRAACALGGIHGKILERCFLNLDGPIGVSQENIPAPGGRAGTEVQVQAGAGLWAPLTARRPSRGDVKAPVLAVPPLLVVGAVDLSRASLPPPA